MTYPNPPKRGLTSDELSQVTTATVDRLNEMVDRLERHHWHEGLAWYLDAHRIASGMARLFGTTVAKAAGVIAVLSPRITWESNLDDAREVWTDGEEGSYYSLGPNVAKALWLAYTEDEVEAVLSGRKVRAFYRNIMHPATSLDVTLDGWMTKALDLPKTVNGNDKYLERRGTYDAISDGFREVAKNHGVYPHQLQAAVWLMVRNGKDT